jgi:methionyl aminopeptidase
MCIDKKKKTGGANAANGVSLDPREQDNSRYRLLGSWKAGEYKQTNPPSIPIIQQYPSGVFPVGEIQEYTNSDFNRKRITDAECREKERLFTSDYEALRRAAECHRQVRKYAQ